MGAQLPAQQTARFTRALRQLARAPWTLTWRQLPFKRGTQVNAHAGTTPPSSTYEIAVPDIVGAQRAQQNALAAGPSPTR